MIPNVRGEPENGPGGESTLLLLSRPRLASSDLLVAKVPASRIVWPAANLQTMATSESSSASTVQPICSLPVVGATTVEDAVFYGAVGVVAVVGLVSWPTAALIGSGHALHQRARNVIRAGGLGEAREGLLEAMDDVA
jgi:hypothetical protein